jgi:hypothetical protein
VCSKPFALAATRSTGLVAVITSNMLQLDTQQSSFELEAPIDIL